MLQMDELKYKSIGKHSRNLINFNENSVYKLLYSHDSLNSNSLNTNSKNIRNNYLKKLVEANDQYFPAELKQEKLKRNLPVSYEEKFNLKNKLEIEKFNNAKGKSNGKDNKNLNKKRPRDEELSRKNSLVLENSKKEKEDLNDENNNFNNDKKNNNNENEYNNDRNKKNKIIEDDDQSEKEQSNPETQSFDEYRMESGENVSNDNGSDNDERDYSDGGVF